MKSIAIVTLMLILAAFWVTPAIGQEAPKYLKDTYPKHALKPTLEARKALGKGAVLDAKTRALVAIGVSAQIPCEYCVYVNHKKARALGATDDEIREAVATAAQVRHWSTVLYGMGYDLEAFQTEVDKMYPAK